MIKIVLALATAYGVTFALARFARLGTIIGLTLGSVLVASLHIIPQEGPVAETVDFLGGTICLWVAMFLSGNAFETRGVLKRSRSWFLIAGQMIGMTLLGAILGKGMGNPRWAGAFIIGFAMMQSSTSIVADALKKRRWENEPPGILSMTLMVIQDVSCGTMPLLVGLLVGAQFQALGLIWLLPLVCGLGALYIFGPKIGEELLGHERSPNEAPFLIGLVVTLGMGFLAQSAGIAPASVAFFAGMLWRRTKFVSKTEAQMGMIRDILVPIFFISALRTADLGFGSLVNGRTWAFILFELVGTFLVTYPLSRLAGIGPMGSALIGVASAQAGEFTFLVVLLGTQSGLISPSEGGSLAFASVITFVVSAVGADFFEPLFQIMRRVIGLIDRAALGEEVMGRTAKPASVVYLDVPEGTEDDVRSAISPWVGRARELWPGTCVLVVESVQGPEEEEFLCSLGTEILVREPYLDPVSILQVIGIDSVRVVISGPALGRRQDLELIRYLKGSPSVFFITVASDRLEAEALEEAAAGNPQVKVVNETRELARDIGRMVQIV